MFTLVTYNANHPQRVPCLISSTTILSFNAQLSLDDPTLVVHLHSYPLSLGVLASYGKSCFGLLSHLVEIPTCHPLPLCFLFTYPLSTDITVLPSLTYLSYTPLTCPSSLSPPVLRIVFRKSPPSSGGKPIISIV